MSHEIPWVRETLLSSYPQLDQDGGVDLDGNGAIEEVEIADANHNNCVSEEEARQFYINNRSVLNDRIDFFRWGSGLSLDNPIHRLIYLESKLTQPSDVQTAYGFVTTVVDEVRESLASIRGSEEITPFRKLARVYLVLQDQDVSFDTQLVLSSFSLFTNSIKRKELDCDTATFILLAVAHELNWPVYAIAAPDHMAARWDEGDGEHIDFETRDGLPTNDYIYMNQFHISQEQVDQRIFLSNLTPAELSGYFYMNRGVTYTETGRLEEAVVDLSRAIELNNRNPMAYFNRAIAHQRLGHLEEALADFNRAVRLWPNDSSSYFNRASVKIRLGQFAEAVEDLNRSLELYPLNSNAIFLRGVANTELGNLEEAQRDFERARIDRPRLGEINYQPGDGIDRILEDYMSNSEAMAFFARAMAKIQVGDFEGALADFSAAIELDPQDELSYTNRGAVWGQLGNYEEAMADLNRALELCPQNARAYYNMALLKIKSEEYEEALRNVERALEIDPENEMIRSLANTLRTHMELNDYGNKFDAPAIKTAR